MIYMHILAYTCICLPSTGSKYKTYMNILVYTYIYMNISTPYVIFGHSTYTAKNTSIYCIYVHILAREYVHEKNGF